jgi:hypothetical protein
MAAIFTLLVVNTLAYLASGTPSEALDSVAWLILLALFELETGHAARLSHPRATVTVRAVRFVAAAALVAALAGYLQGSEWLDALNVGLWVAVVALLELEVRHPELVTRHRVMFLATALVFYAGLAALVAAWLWRGDWFDAYDAALWLTAFATLELDVLGLAPSSGGKKPG